MTSEQYRVPCSGNFGYQTGLDAHFKGHIEPYFQGSSPLQGIPTFLSSHFRKASVRLEKHDLHIGAGFCVVMAEVAVDTLLSQVLDLQHRVQLVVHSDHCLLHLPSRTVQAQSCSILSRMPLP